MNKVNDNNSLNENFYNELLHIIGLEEVKDGKKKLIQRKTKRSRTSLIESAMNRLDISDEKERFEKALNLSMTWINRLLFLKLVEALLVSYHKNEDNKNKYKFLTTDTLVDFNGLNDLFFLVLGKKPHERTEEYKEKYKHVPYLNSSLFELSEEENKYHIKISEVDFGPLEIYKKTVLRDEKGKVLTGTKNNLKYMLEFLDAYNFSNDSDDGVASDTNRLINASVLGLIFEKINGYKDGSYFTPAFITEYMAKEAIERAVVQKFNDVKGWNCSTLDELAEKIDDRTEANRIINSITICDPAVGSGHFLVSVLNRLLYIKSYLNILQDFDGKPIKKSDWGLRLEHDDIFVFDGEGQRFFYSAKNDERQRIQKAIFHEKKTIIENCLFGVDINPTSVYVCRLRLWIELLKNAYYTDETRGSENPQLETLPNIDINIKCGNSLVSKYPVELKKSVLSEDKSTQKLIDEYKKTVRQYKNESNKSKKSEVNQRIQQIKATIHSSAQQLYLFDKEANKKILSEDIYKNSMEWMFEFPEVLDKTGKFLGFDVVIGNPPYLSYYSRQSIKINDIFLETLKNNASFIKNKKDKGRYHSIQFFLDKGTKLISEKGQMIYIIDISFFEKPFRDIREYILDNYHIIEIVSDLVDFENVTSGQIILSIDHDLNKTSIWKSNIDGKPITISSAVWQKDPSREISLPKNDELLKKIVRETKLLSELGDVRTGVNIGGVKKYFLTSDSSYYPFISRGDNIRQYEIHYPTKLQISKGETFFNFDKKIEKEIWDNHIGTPSLGGNNSRFLKPKIIIRQSDTRMTAALDVDRKFHCGYSLFTFNEQTDNIKRLKYILGILNSTLITYYMKEQNWIKLVPGKTPQIRVDDVKKIPIYIKEQRQQQPIIDLVDKILAAKKADPNSDTSEAEREIDKLVYALYGLTEEEIAVVEKASERRNKE